MPEALSFCLARAQRPLLHVDRTAHLEGNLNVLSAVPDQQLLSQDVTNLQTGCLDGLHTAGVTPRLELVKDKSTLYLGETCVFYITLSNQGNSPASAITIRVECSVEGGSNAVLHDNSQSPLPQLPATGRHDVIVQTDIKEQGVITIMASAVYTDRYGERKYHVQFFKFQSASPLSVKTRVRCLPHIQQPARPAGTPTSSTTTTTTLQQPHSSSSSSIRPYCFLEVSVDNSTPLPLVLHAVNLLPSAGLSAKQLKLHEHYHHHQQQQQHQALGLQQHTKLGHQTQQQQQMEPALQQLHLQDQQQLYEQQRQAVDGKSLSNGSSSKQDVHMEGSSDTKLLHDVGGTNSSISSSSSNGHHSRAPAGGPAALAQQQANGLQPQQQQQQQHYEHQRSAGQQTSEHIIAPAAAAAAAAAAAESSLKQGTPHHLQQQGQHQQNHSALQGSSGQLHVSEGLGPLLGGQPPLIVIPPGGGSHNYLWQLEQQQQQTFRSSTSDASSSTAANSSSSAFLGRLELHWSTVDGKTGRLLTQPLSRPISTAAGRDVLMQLTHLLPAAAAARSGRQQQQSLEQQQQQPFLDHLEVGVPVRAVFSLTPAAGLQHQQQAAVGPLLVLYTELSPSGPSTTTAARLSESSSTGGQQQQQPGLTAAVGSGQLRWPGSSGSDSSSRGMPAVAVQGKRSQRIARVLIGESASVEFTLVPLRRGWVRLPTFVVVSEADGRLLDSVHDVQVLVV